MSDISFYGIAALLILIVMGLLSVAGFSILVVLVVGFKRTRLRGYLWSCLASGLLCLVAGLVIEYGRQNTELLKRADQYAPFLAIFLIIAIFVTGYRVAKRSRT